MVGTRCKYFVRYLGSVVIRSTPWFVATVLKTSGPASGRPGQDLQLESLVQFRSPGCDRIAGGENCSHAQVQLKNCPPLVRTSESQAFSHKLPLCEAKPPFAWANATLI
jgi:hypothetical protein